MTVKYTVRTKRSTPQPKMGLKLFMIVGLRMWILEVVSGGRNKLIEMGRTSITVIVTQILNESCKWNFLRGKLVKQIKIVKFA